MYGTDKNKRNKRQSHYQSLTGTLNPAGKGKNQRNKKYYSKTDTSTITYSTVDYDTIEYINVYKVNWKSGGDYYYE